jgi:hypothetical protein
VKPRTSVIVRLALAAASCVAILLLALTAMPAHAHDCNPLAVDSDGVQIGTAAKTLATPAGKVDYYWCAYQNKDTAPGKMNWRMQRIVRLPAWYSPTAILAAAGRIVAAGGSMASVEAELRAGNRTVQPGTRDFAEYERLRWLACLQLVNAPPAVFDTPMTPADCGPEPAPWVPPPPPPPPAGVYAVSGAQAFPLRSDGTRSLTAWAERPTAGEPCDCAVQILQFGARYCKVPRLSTAAQTVVAGCTLKP